MIAFAYIFLAMCVYGLWTAHYGAAAIALVLAMFAAYGKRVFDRKDQEWLSNPSNARKQPDTLAALDEQESESTRSKF